MLTQIYFRLVKGGYEAYDLDNHVAFGKTKELARQQFFLLYQMGVQKPGYDMKEIMKEAKL